MNVAVKGILTVPLWMTTNTLTRVLGATVAGNLTLSSLVRCRPVWLSVCQVNIPPSSCLYRENKCQYYQGKIIYRNVTKLNIERICKLSSCTIFSFEGSKITKISKFSM